MRLDRVTITGADDSVRPSDLIKLTQEFPFVEWGILASRSQQMSPRYPSHGWIMDLQNANNHTPLSLSLHLCGHYVRRLLVGIDEVPSWMWRGFERVQLNFHGERAPYLSAPFAEALKHKRRQFIFQIDGADGLEYLRGIIDRVNAVPLFDMSGGAGSVPVAWPKAEGFKTDLSSRAGGAVNYFGYAGGLGPHNVLSELKRIAEAADGERIWIDMETRVRSSNDRVFDLGLVRSVLESCAMYVSAS
jgi:hypothetical protein